MTTDARTHALAHAAPEAAPVPAPTPRLRLTASHRRTRGLPAARTVAAYAVGLTAGFLLAAGASAPGGLDALGGQLRLAGLAAVGALVAALVAARGRRSGATTPEGR